ncbi:MAG: phosphate uptake regulator PhoU [Methanosarcinales archaeon]|nr:phosphate uptake regulator PhoU [Methanosarcinales archaeon]
MRKVQRTGGSTYIISLPKSWATSAGIGEGSSVQVIPQPDGTLIIEPIGGNKRRHEMTLDVSQEFGDVLERKLIAAYLGGSERIRVVGSPIQSQQKKVIRNICQRLIGPEIIEESADMVVIQDILNPQEMPIRKSMLRMSMIVDSMQADSIHALINGDIDLAQDVVGRDDDVDRLYLLIAKQFRSILKDRTFQDNDNISIERRLDLRLCALSLERIADHAQKIAKIAVESEDFSIPMNMEPHLKSLCETTRQMVRDSVSALNTLDTTLANSAMGQKDAVEQEIALLEKSVFNAEYEVALSLGIITDSMGRIADYASNIAEVAINSAVLA